MTLATVPGGMQPVQCWALSGPLPQFCYLPELQNPSNSPETFPEATVFLGPVVGDSVPSKVENKAGEREQTSQQAVPVAGGSMEQRGLPLHPPTSPSRPLFPCCDRGFSWGPQTGGFLPSPPARRAWTAGGNRRWEPALHSNNNRLPAHWRPCWGAGLGPERPPTPPRHWQNMFSCFLRGGGGPYPS